jgi:hypothetical protein
MIRHEGVLGLGCQVGLGIKEGIRELAICGPFGRSSICIQGLIAIITQFICHYRISDIWHQTNIYWTEGMDEAQRA